MILYVIVQTKYDSECSQNLQLKDLRNIFAFYILQASIFLKTSSNFCEIKLCHGFVSKTV